MNKRGPFAIFLRRSGNGWRVTALYQGRGWRIARSSGGWFRDRTDALFTVRLIAREIQT